MARPELNSIFCKKPAGLRGLEKIIELIKSFSLKASFSLNGTLYGKVPGEQSATQKNKSKKQNAIERALDKGLINILDEISSVDFCNLINYLTSQIGGSSFNPNKVPENPEALDLWKIQFEAYKLQLLIDKNIAEIGDVLTPDSTVRLAGLINIITDTLQNKIGLVIEDYAKKANSIQGISSEESEKLNKTFKKLIILQLVFTESAKILDVLGTNIRVGSAQKALNAINKVRQTCILVQGLSNPAIAISAINNISGGLIQSQANRINKTIPIDKLIPLLKKILKRANEINSIGQKIIGQIRTIQFIIKIAITIIKVFNTIKFFFLINFQLPNLFTTVSTTSTASNVVEEKINPAIKKLQDDLEQINYTLCIIINFCNFLVLSINEIVPRLNAILLNIQSCNNTDGELAQEISDTINNLNNTRDQLDRFLNTVNSPINQPGNTFGEYTIEIVTEQVVDEGINLRRRFGIARGKNNIIAVQSTPTFASLDLIIINEVKTLLVASGLVKASSLGLTVDTLSAVSQSLVYLEDESITIDSLQGSPELDIDTEEESVDLQSFIDNLPGGKALRRRVRNKLIRSNEKLIKELRAADPTSQSTQRLIRQKTIETNKLKIQKLEDQKANLQKLLLLSPALGPAIISKIKAIDKDILQLKNNLK